MEKTYNNFKNMVMGKAYDIDGAYGAQCCAKGTYVLKEDGYYEKIERLKPGDKLWGGNTVLSNESKEAECLHFVTSSGYLCCTPDHKFAMKDGSFREANNFPWRNKVPADDELFVPFTLDLPAKISNLTEDELRSLGYWMMHGFKRYQSEDPDLPSIFLQIPTKANVEKLRDIDFKIGLPISKDSTIYEIRFPERRPRFVEAVAKCHGNVPSLLDYGLEEIPYIYEGAMLIEKNTEQRITVEDRRLALVLQVYASIADSKFKLYPPFTDTNHPDLNNTATQHRVLFDKSKPFVPNYCKHNSECPEKKTVYVLNVDGTNTYWAENLLCHNCWDGAMYYSRWLGYPVFNCGITGYAQDIWTMKNTSGILNYYNEVELMNPGDIAVFKVDADWVPLSHIAIFDSDIDGSYGWFLGQNQGAPNMAFNLLRLPYYTTYPTAFRPKCFATPNPAPAVSAPDPSGKMYGLDLSQHNGTLDFNAIKNAGNSFVILRAGFGWSTDQKDPNFETYYKQAKDAGLKIGCYWYTYGRNLDEAREEARCFKEVIKGKTFDFGVWVDLEDADGWKANNGNPSGETQAQIANLIAREMKAAGYDAGIYASTYYIDNIYKGLDINNFRLWEANYGANDGEIHSDHSNRADIHQYTSQWPLNGKVFDRNVAYTNLSTEPEVIKSPVVEEPEGSIYRLYNATTGDHLYTLSFDEALAVYDAGWSYEGIDWVAPKEGTDVHRLYNPTTGVHHYCFEEEKNALVTIGWVYDGVAFKSAGNNPVYRLYNPNSGQHFLTSRHEEHDALIKAGWICEGKDIKY